MLLSDYGGACVPGRSSRRVSCSAKGRAAYLAIETDVACPVECTLRPGESAQHEVRLSNRGPLAARIRVECTCNGPLLQYGSGSPNWSCDIELPKNRGNGNRAAQAIIQVPSAATPSAFGDDEAIEVQVKRAYGIDQYEAPVSLPMHVTLKS